MGNALAAEEYISQSQSCPCLLQVPEATVNLFPCFPFSDSTGTILEEWHECKQAECDWPTSSYSFIVAMYNADSDVCPYSPNSWASVTPPGSDVCPCLLTVPEAAAMTCHSPGANWTVSEFYENCKGPVKVWKWGWGQGWGWVLQRIGQAWSWGWGSGWGWVWAQFR